MLRQNLKQLQEAQKLEKKCNDYIKQCKNQLDQLKLEYSVVDQEDINLEGKTLT